MYRVMIAEEPACTGVAEQIDWEKLGCCVQANTSDGTQALSLIDTLQPDILISGVCLPGSTGTQLAQHIRQAEYRTRVIFVTSCDRFESARDAVVNSVVDYLLHPFSAEVLYDAVKRAIALLENDSYLQEEREQFLLFRKKNFAAERASIIRESALYLLEDHKSLQEKLSFFDLQFAQYQLAVVQMEILESEPDCIELDAAFKKYLIGKMIEEVLVSLSCAGKGYVVEYQRHCSILLVGDVPVAELPSALYEIRNRVFKELNVTLTFGVSNPFYCFEEIGKYFVTAEQALSAKFYFGAGSVILFSKVLQSNNFVGAGYRPLLRQLVESIHVLDTIRAEELCGLLVAEVFQTERRSAMAIRSVFMQVFIMFADELSNCGINLWEIFDGPQPFEYIQQAENITDITEFLFECVERIIQGLKEKQRSCQSAIVQNIIDYLKTEYINDIALDDVARLVCMNPSYVSRLIKQQMGKNFVEILRDIRIDEAKKLLSDPTVKAYRVAELVGISDSKYFSILFKKVTGMTPTEYRTYKNEP